jgi:UDP-N-acetylmuramoylalanine--D-glutamate ligase
VAAAILNIAQDHIDWHGSFDAYATDKVSILDRATTAILNGEDGEIVSRVAHWQGQKIFFSLDTPGPGEIGIVEELLVDRAFVPDPQEAAMIAELTEVKPTVPHSVSNALAAAGLALSVGVAHEALRSAIVEFIPGRHRIEKIYEAEGISWIDDSKATNPHAASASIMSALSVIWVAGGLAKGAEMGELIERIKARVRGAILIGEDRHLIAQEIQERAPHIWVELIDAPIEYTKGGENNSLMEHVVRLAKSKAVSGDTVLLAPACASMDQFLSYSDRGDRFKRAVEKVVRNGN